MSKKDLEQVTENGLTVFKDMGYKITPETENKYWIGVEDVNYENAVFYGEEFICYEDDMDCILDVTNELDTKCRQLEKENEQLKEFKEKVFDEIDNELHYLKEKSNDNPVNRGRIKALEQLETWVLLQ